MCKFEKRVILFIEEHLYSILVVCITLLGFLIRFSLRHYISRDATKAFLPWFDQMREAGGIHGLGEQVGNYSMLYQFLIALMTYTPFSALYSCKILSCIFDYLLALASGKFVYDFGINHSKWEALLAYGLVILSPIVFLNSAMWSQCESIYVFFIVLSLIAVCKEHYVRTFIFYGIALAFKLQAVFFLPFLLLFYFYKRSFSLLHFLIIPAVMSATAIPGMLMGRKLTDLLGIYLDQTNLFSAMSMNYPSFWVIVNDGGVEETYAVYKDAAIIFTICVLGGWMVYWLVNRIKLNYQNLLSMAFILAYTCVLFLPAMHERYGYMYEILGILIVFFHKKTFPLLLALLCISFMTYGFYFHRRVIDITVLAIINLAVYVGYGFLLNRKSEREAE